MSFASLPFVGLVTAGVVLYYLVPKRAQWVVLLLASMVFYLVGGVKSAVWLVLVAGLTWLAGLLLEKQNARPAPDKAAKTAVRRAKKQICVACLVLCFGLLYLMKYWNFTASALPSALGTSFPGGISSCRWACRISSSRAWAMSSTFTAESSPRRKIP